jgi:cardiolipin synthase
MRTKLGRVVFRRRVFVILTLLVQIIFLICLLAGAGIYFQYISWILRIISIGVCIHVINKHTKPAYKIIWVFLIMLFPIFGGILYIFFRSQSNPRKLRRLIEQNIQESRDAFYLGGDRLDDLDKIYPEFKPQAHYLQHYAGFPVYANTKSLYFDSGEKFFERVLDELKKAKR